MNFPETSQRQRSYKMKDEEELWKVAYRQQDYHGLLLNGTLYDSIPRDNLEVFKKILYHYLSSKVADNLFNRIIRRGNDLVYRILIVNCLTDDGLITSPVIRVLERGVPVFYDQECRKYSDWKDFLECNKYPAGIMLYPENGFYSKNKGIFKLSMGDSPSSSLFSKVDKTLYEIADVLSFATMILPMFSFAKPFTTTIRWTSAFSNGYKIGHHSYQLYDRKKHGQSISIHDEEAAMHWSHIGNGFLSFAFTYGTTQFYNSSQEVDYLNLLKLIDMFREHFKKKDPHEAMEIIKGHILCQHMFDLQGNAVSYLQSLISDNNININIMDVICAVKKYLGVDCRAVVRKLTCVDGKTMEKVGQDIKNCYEIPHILQTSLLEKSKEYINFVDKIMKEVNLWKCQTISERQLQFRISEMCKERTRKYETITEMCHYFKVDNLEDIELNGKKIFQNVGAKKLKLENLLNGAVEKYPQLLAYAVEYASSQNTCVDWDGFKIYFKMRFMEEMCDNFNYEVTSSNISWINAINFQEVKISTQISGKEFHLLKPNNPSVSLCTQDFVNLGKKVMGEMQVDVVVAKPPSEWVVMISKRKRIVFVKGPKFEVENNLISDSYPVFVRCY